MAERPRMPALVIGLGNRLRGDDGAGLEAARLLGGAEHDGEPLALLDRWEGADAVVLVDAVSSGAPAGTIHRVDVSAGAVPQALRGAASTHAIGLAEAIELARAVGRLPARAVVYGIEGERFAAGDGLSRPVRATMGDLVAAVAAEAGLPRPLTADQASSEATAAWP